METASSSVGLLLAILAAEKAPHTLAFCNFGRIAGFYMDNSARKGGTVQWRTSERIIRANERLLEYLHRAGGRARGGTLALLV